MNINTYRCFGPISLEIRYKITGSPLWVLIPIWWTRTPWEIKIIQMSRYMYMSNSFWRIREYALFHPKSKIDKISIQRKSNKLFFAVIFTHPLYIEALNSELVTGPLHIHHVLRSKRKDWLSWNQYFMSEWNVVSVI